MAPNRTIAAAVLGGAALMSLPDLVHAQALPIIKVNQEIGLAFGNLILNYKEHLGDDAEGAHDCALG